MFSVEDVRTSFYLENQQNMSFYQAHSNMHMTVAGEAEYITNSCQQQTAFHIVTEAKRAETERNHICGNTISKMLTANFAIRGWYTMKAQVRLAQIWYFIYFQCMQPLHIYTHDVS